MRKILLVLALTALAAFGADVTGTWSGSFVTTSDGETKDDTAYMVLTQEGSTIRGTAGPTADHQFPIKTGTIAGNKITLELTPPSGSSINFVLTIAGDRMTGEAQGEDDGQKRTAKVDIKREKK